MIKWYIYRQHSQRTSIDKVREILRNAGLAGVKWVDTWLENRQIAIELDGNSGSVRTSESCQLQGLPLTPVLFGLT
jgi:hypothetical protein